MSTYWYKNIGNRESLMDFGFDLNTNSKKLKLTWEISDESINFLDLEIAKEGGV